MREDSAVLQSAGLSAEIALRRPSEGLVNLVAASDSLRTARLLGIAAGPIIEGPTTNLVESYVRGDDLVVAYEGSSQWPIRVDALWRLTTPSVTEKVLAAVDLIVSIRTHVLDARPDLAVESVVPSSGVFRLPTGKSAACEPLGAGAAVPTVVGPESGAGCLLFRLPGLDLTYAEMVHPTDFQRDELSCRTQGGGTLHIAHRLFRTNLEKGVILRARVRGLFAKRQGDAETAAACYAAFASAEPPLAPREPSSLPARNGGASLIGGMRPPHVP